MKLFDRFRRSRSVALGGASVAFSLAGDTAIYTAMPIIFDDLGLLPVQVGVLLSVNRFARLITNPLAHSLLRRVTARALLIGSLLLGSAVTVFYSLVPPFALFVLLRVLWGLCWSILRQVGVMNSAGRSTSGDPVRLVGLYEGVLRGGYFGGSLLAGVLVDAVGMAVMFQIMAGIMLLGIVPALAAFRPGERVATRRAVQRKEVGPRGITRIEVLKGVVFGSAGYGIISSTLGIALTDIAGESVRIGTRLIGIATINGILLALRSLLGVIGSPFVGSLLDSIGIRKGEIIAFALGSAALLGAYFAASAVPTAALVMLFSLFELVIGIALTAEMNRSSRVYAQFASALDTGAAVGPIVAWVLIDLMGVRRVGFILGFILYALGLLLSTATHRKYGNNPAHEPRS